MVVGRDSIGMMDVLNQPKTGIHFRLFLAVMLHQRGKMQPSIRTSSSLRPETRTLAIIPLQIQWLSSQLLLTIPPLIPSRPAPLLTLPHRTIHPSPNTKRKEPKPKNTHV